MTSLERSASQREGRALGHLYRAAEVALEGDLAGALLHMERAEMDAAPRGPGPWRHDQALRWAWVRLREGVSR